MAENTKTKKPKEERIPFPTYPLRDIVDTILGVPHLFVRANRPRDRIYASEIGQCQRAVWRNWKHPRPHDEKFDRGRGALGHAVEDMLALQLAPVLVAREVSFVNTYISGRADFFIRLPHGPQVPVEAKSTYAMNLSVANPKVAHVRQLQYYEMASDAPFGILIYLNLGNWGGQSGEWVALYVPRDDVAVETRAKYLYQLVQQDVEPECENLSDPKGCFDCSLTEEAAPK